MEKHDAALTAPAAAPAFADLPEGVLALTASLGLTEARDVACLAATNKRLAAVCKAAPLRLGVPVQATGAPREEQAEARATLRALCASWPGTAELDLRGCPLEDHDVQLALDCLPRLAALQLSGCKKLTPALTAGLPQRPQLRTVTLQRCFQLTAAALTDAMSAASEPGSRLACVALSHLSLAGWPEKTAVAAGRLRMLALHNCSKLSGAALEAIAAACPHLEVLMLGGSALALEEPSADGLAAAGDDDCTGGSGAAAAASQASSQQYFYQQALATVLEAAPSLGFSFCSYVAAMAARLAGLACRLPCLRVLELTFALPGLVPALQRLAGTEPLLLEGRAEPLQVWDLCSSASVGQALHWRRDVRTCYCAADISSSGGAAGSISPSDAAAFLCAAANCSSGARSTPLHAAAEEASPAQLRALLGLGAQVDARDRSGASPLFAACEAGHLASVECLLGAGASATLRNSAGEAPLYIAALKGHEHIVDALLLHCQQLGIRWQAQRLYDGDGWTPLMAAAVGGRTPIVAKLLQAAGPEAEALVAAANRYGQTAVHIAARKGSAGLLRSLVDAGGAASLASADCEGTTAAEIARRHGNGGAMRVLADASGVARREQQRQRGTVPTAQRARVNEHRQQQQGPPRWVGRRLQQRKVSGPAQGGSGGSRSSSSSGH